MRERISYGALVAYLSLLVIVLAAGSLSVGYAPLDIREAVVDAVQGRSTLGALVLVELRIPRMLLGALVGFSLGIAGAAMQGLLRNPLAEPGITGVSGMAALGAVIVFYSVLRAERRWCCRWAASRAPRSRPSCCTASPARARAP